MRKRVLLLLCLLLLSVGEPLFSGSVAIPLVPVTKDPQRLGEDNFFGLGMGIGIFARKAILYAFHPKKSRKATYLASKAYGEVLQATGICVWGGIIYPRKKIKGYPPITVEFLISSKLSLF